MNTTMLIAGETSDLRVDPPGFIIRVSRGLPETVTMLAHHGRRSAITVAAGESLTHDDRLRLTDALQALPEEWLLSFTGIETTVSAAASRLESAMSKIESGLNLWFSNYSPALEAAITNDRGEIIVLLQQVEKLGVSGQNPRHLATHVAKTEHIGVVLGAIHEFCVSNEVTTFFNDPLSGGQTARWNFARTDQVRAFLEEFEPHLDDFDYCQKANLVKFCKADLSRIHLLARKEILDF